MGLLDNFTRDDILSGLLSAGAASNAKGHYLARVAAGLTTGEKFNAWKQDQTQKRSQNEMEREYKQLLMAKTKMEMAQSEAAVAQKTKLQEMMMQLTGGAKPVSEGAFATPAVDGVGPTMPRGVGDARSQGSGMLGAGALNQVNAIRALGGPDLLPNWNAVNHGDKATANSWRQMPDGTLQYLGDPSKGLEFNSTGTSASGIPGFNEATAALKGAETRAAAQANADFDFVEIPNSDGTTSKMPRAQALGRLNGGGTGPNGSNGLDMSRVSPEQAARLLELDPQAFAAGVSRFGPSQMSSGQGAGPVFGTSQSPAAAARAIDTAKADVVRETTTAKDDKTATRLTSSADRALVLLGQGPTESGFGTMVDRAAGVFGVTPKGAETADKLRTLSGWMVANVPRMEGPQSNFDVQNYQTMAGAVGDSTLPTSRRIAAATEVKRLQEKYASQNPGGVYPSDAQKPEARTASLSDIAETARKSGRTTAEVTQALRAKGYTIGGN